MIIFKIIKNGTPISEAGGKFIQLIHTSVSYLEQNNSIRLVSTGLNEPDEKHHEHVSWFEEVSLKPGDEIRIKVLDGEKADIPVVKKYFGNVERENGEIDHYCLFCGAKASKDVGMLIHRGNANICHECLRRFNPDKSG